MTKRTNPSELQDTDLDEANGGITYPINGDFKNSDGILHAKKKQGDNALVCNYFPSGN